MPRPGAAGRRGTLVSPCGHPAVRAVPPLRARPRGRAGGGAGLAGAAAAVAARPPYSCSALVAVGIPSAAGRRRTLRRICRFVFEHFPSYRSGGAGWQSRIRHNLSRNLGCRRVPRGRDQPGKGSSWTPDPNCEMMFDNGSFRRRKKRRAEAGGDSAGDQRVARPPPPEGSARHGHAGPELFSSPR